jgi:hypothetical protein
MNTVAFKTLLKKEIQTLDEKGLEKVYGFISNLKNELIDWTDISTEEIKKILEGLSDLKEGKTIEHSILMQKMKQKIQNA